MTPTPEDLQQLRALVNEANVVGSSAAAMSGERLRKCVQVGILLITWKESIPHGKWSSWLDSNLPELQPRTRQRWMNLAQLEREGKLDLQSARGLRNAYQLAQLLPEADAAKKGTDANAVKGGYVVHISRLCAALSSVRIDELSEVDRSTLKQRLKPIVEVFTKL